METRLRKKIYLLQENPGPVTLAALRVALGAYGVVDDLFLKRAQKADLKAEKLVSEDKRFFCALVPKCGSRTLITGFRSAARGRFSLDVFEGSITRCVGRYDDYFRFAFVRNPWSRCYSCYKQKIEDYTPIKGALHFHGRKGLEPGMSFAEFARWLAGPEGRDEIADRHWLSQHRTLGLDIGMRYDIVNRLEDMDEGLAAICARFGIDPAVFVRQLQTSEADEYLGQYDEALLDLVGARYARDVELFGYERPRLETIPAAAPAAEAGPEGAAGAPPA